MTDQEIYEILRERYFYREDGRLCWKSDSPRHKAGQAAGWQVHGRRYRHVRTQGGHLAEHRAIFLFHFGHLPEVVDHINGDSVDNRIENLRASTHQNNAINRKKQRNNSSGYTGVIRKGNRWVARIQISNKTINLGAFGEYEAAVEARQKAEKRYHGELRRR